MQTLMQTRMKKSVELMRFPLSRNRMGLILGAFLGLWHTAWSGVVALGLGQKLIDIVLWLHFLSVPVQVQPFSASRAFGLIVFTSALGYTLGWTFVAAWEGNRRR